MKQLGGAWHINLEGGDTGRAQQCAVVAQDGVLYVATTQQNIFAVNGRTGAVKWKTSVGTETTNMRGVALGERLAFTISGANIIYALDQRTGAVVWTREMLIEDQGDPGCDPASGQCGGSKGSLAGAVVYWDGLIYVGTQGSTAGARGRGYALNAATGEVVWTFWGTPGPGEFGHDTWEGDTWKTGGAVCWIHPAVDPELGLVYWTFGNPYPRTDGSTRGGDNLFANCLVAIDAKTGKRRWHFQSVHHDIWDYDGVMSPVLADIQIKGRKREVVVYGSKTGMYYILDRATGDPVHGMEERPVPQHAAQKTSPTQPFPGGEPFVETEPRIDKATRPVPFYATGGVFEVHWDRPTILYPGAGGGADWSSPSFSHRTGLVYVGYGLINSAYSNTHGGRVNTARPLGEYFAERCRGRRSPYQHGLLAAGGRLVARPRQRRPQHRERRALPGAPRRSPDRPGRLRRRGAVDLAVRRGCQHQPHDVRGRRRAVRGRTGRMETVCPTRTSRAATTCGRSRSAARSARPPPPHPRPSATRSARQPSAARPLQHDHAGAHLGQREERARDHREPGVTERHVPAAPRHPPRHDGDIHQPVREQVRARSGRLLRGRVRHRAADAGRLLHVHLQHIRRVLLQRPGLSAEHRQDRRLLAAGFPGASPATGWTTRAGERHPRPLATVVGHRPSAILRGRARPT